MPTSNAAYRVGIVSSVDEEARRVRVIFPEAGDLVSGWMYVISTFGLAEETELTTESAGEHNHSIPEHNHNVTVDNASVTVQSVGDHTHSVDSHKHTVTIGEDVYDTSSDGTTTGAAGGHTHGTDAHSHSASTSKASQTDTGKNGTHQHQIPKHTHKIVPWLPEVNDRVLCLVSPGSDSDGYVLGAIQ